MTRPAHRGRSGEKVTVRLSEIPEQKRYTVADRLIRTEGLVGEAAMEMLLAATFPRHDPEVTVAIEDARRVLGR
jgi:hypothetical protein